MWKFFAVISFVFVGCANWEFNAAMCDKIASDPNAVIPQECKNYNEKEAQKAFDKIKQKKQSKEDIVEFNREEDEKEN